MSHYFHCNTLEVCISSLLDVEGGNDTSLVGPHPRPQSENLLLSGAPSLGSTGRLSVGGRSVHRLRWNLLGGSLLDTPLGVGVHVFSRVSLVGLVESGLLGAQLGV